MQHARHDEQERDRARVAPQLARARAAPWRAVRERLTRPPRLRRVAGTPRRDRRRPVRRRSSSGVRSARIAPSAQEQEPVAARRLVHHVARDEQRRAAVGELVEEVPQVAAQHRVEPDGRLVEHEDVGLVEERRRERDARLLPAREPPDEVCGHVGEADALDHRVDARSRRTEDPREVRRGSRAPRGRRRPTAPASRSRRGSAARARRRGARARSPSPAATIWTPTIDRISVDLPLPLGPSRPVTTPAVDARASRSWRTVATTTIDTQAA